MKPEYIARLAIPELKELSSDQVRKLRKSYNLSDKAIIDDQLVDTLTKDMYRGLSGFNLHNPIDQTLCTKYVLNQIYGRLGGSDTRGGRLRSYKANIGGDAWEIGDNIIKGSGTKLFSLYDDKQNYFSGNGDLRQQTESAHQNWNPNLKQLRIGDVVGLYYAPSPHQQELKTRTGVAEGYKGYQYNTHSGIVVGYDGNGNPIVSHNIHGKVYNEPLIKGTTRGGYIVSAYRPNWQKVGYSYKQGGRLKLIPRKQ